MLGIFASRLLLSHRAEAEAGAEAEAEAEAEQREQSRSRIACRIPPTPGYNDRRDLPNRGLERR
jgi:hypothetical protein